MREVLIAVGLVLVIEGALYALFPNAVRRMMALALDQEESRLRAIGLVGAVSGFVIVYLVHR